VTIRILEGHILDVLAREPAGSIHCAVTSPPYLWLRAYGTEPQVWPDGWMGELGQEETPELYVQHLVAVMEAVKRVLRDDGTLWVNLAGCYFNDPGGQNGTTGNVSAKAIAANGAQGRQQRGRHPWLKPLDWVDVPGLFAHAMQAAGWLWRSDVVWVKPSALPESVSGTRWERCRVKVQSLRKETLKQAAVGHRDGPGCGIGLAGTPSTEWADCPGCPRCAKTEGYVLRRGNGRPTKSTERVLLFIKRSGAYFDSEAVREPGSLNSHGGMPTSVGPKLGEVRGDGGVATMGIPAGANGRNLRDWWVLSASPIKDEHYAAFPPELPTRCIKAGTSERGCCPGCGAPWARVIHKQERPQVDPSALDRYGTGEAGVHRKVGQAYQDWLDAHPDQTLGWRPTCRCPAHEPVPCRVLDPFAGSGTTLIAADRLGRDAVGVELKPSYVQLAQRRVTGDAPLLLWGAVTVEGAQAEAVGAPVDSELTKQERHPNRIVADFNQRWKASQAALEADTTGSVPEAVPLLLEEPEDAVAGG
jgi:DNA modification methylase